MLCTTVAVSYVADSHGAILTPRGRHIGYALAGSNDVFTVIRVGEHALPMLLSHYATRLTDHTTMPPQPERRPRRPPASPGVRYRP
ncbi:hypothetical protein ABZ891_18140 [Streptomyces sp. NPDC047023]|uniref:hypothetical protein n=1 Tax=Streptomyces sp. NPDC047023 TaxID=3155139 RepID=UPI0033C81B96